jgi:CheY-like chemotaxis protein
LLESFRVSVSQLGRNADEASARRNVVEFSQNVRLLREKAGLVALPVWRMARLLEGLLKQLAERPDIVTPTTVRTIAGAVDVLHSLSARDISTDLLHAPPVRLLVVDDDPVSLRTLSHILKKSLAEPDQAADGNAAVLLAQAYSYDAIFLDIEMPGIDGFEACSRILSTTRNRVTPVVFVTSHSDLAARARSLLVGAHDLVSKPFLSFEIALKALTVVLSRRLQSQVLAVPARAPSARAASPHPAAPVGSSQTAKSSVSVMELVEA